MVADFNNIWNIICLGHEKKKPCFMGGQTFWVGLVGQDNFLFFFSFWWQKWLP